MVYSSVYTMVFIRLYCSISVSICLVSIRLYFMVSILSIYSTILSMYLYCLYSLCYLCCVLSIFSILSSLSMVLSIYGVYMYGVYCVYIYTYITISLYFLWIPYLWGLYCLSILLYVYIYNVHVCSILYMVVCISYYEYNRQHEKFTVKICKLH